MGMSGAMTEPMCAPHILDGKVMHKRLLPRENRFTYGIYYLACPIKRLNDMADGRFFGINCAGVLSFYNRDHADRSGNDLQSWITPLLAQHGLEGAGHNITLVTMPRVLGYVFNPVSFWLCHNEAGQLRAVLCEVNNTFGESHSYLCAHTDHREITGDDWLEGQKLFHVSPFLQREGHYKFRFSIKPDNMGIWIDYYDADGKKTLLTALTGKLVPYTVQAMRRQFWRHPLVTMTAIARIHWQAIKLIFKGIRYIPKPLQMHARQSTSTNLTKM